MSEPFIGQITQIAFNFAPRGYAYCDGQELPVEQNLGLFSLLKTQFGGDGQTTFNLPDLRGRVPVHPGNDIPFQGYKGGSEQVTLDLSTMTAHTHGFVGTTSEGDAFWPNPAATNILANAKLANSGEPQPIYGLPRNPIQLNPKTVTSTGDDQPHDNLQPSLVIGFIIALRGQFPQRN